MYSQSESQRFSCLQHLFSICKTQNAKLGNCLRLWNELCVFRHGIWRWKHWQVCLFTLLHWQISNEAGSLFPEQSITQLFTESSEPFYRILGESWSIRTHAHRPWKIMASQEAPRPCLWSSKAKPVFKPLLDLPIWALSYSCCPIESGIF